MIRIDHLVKRFGSTTAVDDVTLAIEPGESVALWGTNGAGKTTIIRCLLGLLPYSGTIRVAGLDAARHGKRARALIGYVPQELGFYDDLRVFEAVRLFARLKHVAITSVASVLTGVGLAGSERKRIRELSGGMKQRLALAIALLGDPPILVLDEVTASLDACGREEFVNLLSGLAGRGRAMLFASHRVDEITALATRVVMLDRGRITAECAARGFIERLGYGATLHLHLDAPSRQPALDLLRTHGFDPKLNGVGLLVPVPSSQKAAPFRILADARLSVTDFEILGAAPPAQAPAQETRP